MTGSETLKRCSKCGQLKARDAFGRSNREADGLQYTCKACRASWSKANAEQVAERNRKYKQANEERLREYSRKYRTENSDRIAEHMREYRANNRDGIAQSNHEYWEANKTLIAERKRLYNAANAARIAERRREYAHSDRGRLVQRAGRHRRRARKFTSGGTYTPADIESIRIAQNNRCYLCHKKLKTYHIDHFIPLALGGSNDPGNLRLACPHCNQSKGAKHPHDIGRLI